MLLTDLSHNRDRVAYDEAPMLVVAVADLPWPHDLFRCKQHDVFQTQAPAGLANAERQPHVERIARSFSEPQIRRCYYHRPNWHWVTRAAIGCFERGVQPGPGECVDAARAAGEGRDTGAALMWLFVDPIFVSGDQIGNGQHRVCGMKLAGVSHCLIEA